MKHLLTGDEFSGEEVFNLVQLGIKVKEESKNYYNALERKGILLLFQKTSTRTSLSFQSAINQTGGYAVSLDWDRSNFSISPIHYEARYVSRNIDLIAARLIHHSDLKILANGSTVPVINGCDEKYHPCQGLGDLMSIFEVKRTFDNIQLTYVGVHNNVANSLIINCLKLGVKLNLLTPIVNERSWDAELMSRAKTSGLIDIVTDLSQVIDKTDFIYTDTWIDMENFYNPGICRGEGSQDKYYDEISDKSSKSCKSTTFYHA